MPGSCLGRRDWSIQVSGLAHGLSIIETGSSQRAFSWKRENSNPDTLNRFWAIAIFEFPVFSVVRYRGINRRLSGYHLRLLALPSRLSVLVALYVLFCVGLAYHVLTGSWQRR